MSGEQHYTELHKNGGYANPCWFATCSCGWMGSLSLTRKRDALEDADEHVRIMAGDPWGRESAPGPGEPGDASDAT